MLQIEVFSFPRKKFAGRAGRESAEHQGAKGCWFRSGGGRVVVIFLLDVFKAISRFYSSLLSPYARLTGTYPHHIHCHTPSPTIALIWQSLDTPRPTLTLSGGTWRVNFLWRRKSGGNHNGELELRCWWRGRLPCSVLSAAEALDSGRGLGQVRTAMS
jgi:hypothetical protein